MSRNSLKQVTENDEAVFTPRPHLENNSVKQEVPADLEFTLMHDFDRFSNGTLMMALTNATFEHQGIKGEIRVDMGGTVVEVSVGSKRSWKISLGQIAAAALDADANYLKGKQ